MANRPGQLENSMSQNLEIPHIHPLNKVVINNLGIQQLGIQFIIVEE